MRICREMKTKVSIIGKNQRFFIRYWLGIISKRTRLSIAFLLFFDLAFLVLTPAFDAEIRLLRNDVFDLS